MRIWFGLKFLLRAAVDSFCGIGQTQLMIKDESRITTFVEFLICGNIMRVCLSNDTLLNSRNTMSSFVAAALLLLDWDRSRFAPAADAMDEDGVAQFGASALDDV